MGKKVNPRIIRLNTTTTHLSKWFAPKRQFADLLQQDVMIRKFLKKKLKDSGVSRIEIRRSNEQLNLLIRTSKPGVIIGRSGSGIELTKKQLKQKFFGSKKINISMEIEEVRQPDLDAELVAQNIIYQLEKRVPFRRAMKRSIEQVMAAGALGVKIICAGRLNGVEIARTETLSEGSVPTHTLRANIDYSRAAAHTLYGAIGIKVWIYKGQVFADAKTEAAEPVRPSGGRGAGERSHRRSQNRASANNNNVNKRTIVKKHTVKPQE